MRIFLYLLLSTLISICHAEVVNKWIDADGKVHYGDQPAPQPAILEEKLYIQDSFDKVEAVRALQRNSEDVSEEYQKIYDRYKEKRAQKDSNWRQLDSQMRRYNRQYKNYS